MAERRRSNTTGLTLLLRLSLWLLPLLCFYPQRAWIVFSGLVVLSYHVLIRFVGAGVWEESLWIKYAIYLPFYTLLLLDVRRTLFSPVNTQATS